MSDQQHGPATELYLQARELDPEQRRAFLDRECAGKPELRKEVQAYLDHDPVPSTLTVDDTPSPRPTTIGKYRLLQLLGKGGMGEVWEAKQQEPIRRRVALKLILQGMDTQEIVARFVAERQALALMAHKNVATVPRATTQSIEIGEIVGTALRSASSIYKPPGTSP